MKKIKKDVKISYLAAHVTTIISVTLLLLLVGLIGLLTVAARSTAREVRQQQQVSVVMADSVTNEGAMPVVNALKSKPYTLDVELVTKEAALADWNAQTNDDLEAVAGYNFLAPEVTFRIKEAYSDPQHLKAVATEIKALPGVDDVVTPDPTTVRSMDNFFGHAFIVLGITALVMIIISFVLINNTVLLTIYSRRFTIHTMQLVGATNGFIRRPFITNNILSGLIAATVASAIILGVIAFLCDSEFPALYTYLPWSGILLIIAALYAAGVLICGIAARCATARYLRRNYDDLYK